MGFPYFEMEFSTRFPYFEMKLSELFPRFPRFFRGLEMGFPSIEMKKTSKMLLLFCQFN